MHQKQPIIFDRLLLRDLLKCDRACSMIRITYQVGGKRMKLHLSKSKYCNAVQCPKMLWMQLNHPELFDDSVMNQTILENGNEVGDLARGLFGDYTIVEFGEYPDMLNRTQELLNNGTANIAEASFAYQGLFCRVDILRNLGNNKFELYEVKSSTSVHDIYYHDVGNRSTTTPLPKLKNS